LGKAAAQRAGAGEPVFLGLTPDANASAGAWEVELQLGAGVFLRLRRPC
jgi:hypothetical protein